MIQVISFGDHIPRGRYRVTSRFPEAVNFVNGDELVSVVSTLIGAGPINIVLSGIDFAAVKSLQVNDSWFSLDETVLGITSFYDSGFPSRGTVDLARLRENLRVWADLLQESAHPKSLAFFIYPQRRQGFTPGFETALVESLSAGMRRLLAGELEAGTKALRGAGFGLTPSGDDFLAGYLWGLNARQKVHGEDHSEAIRTIHRNAGSGNPLARAYLRCARQGLFFEMFRCLLDALLHEAGPEVARRAAQLLAVGETSGADVSVGFLAALGVDDRIPRSLGRCRQPERPGDPNMLDKLGPVPG